MAFMRDGRRICWMAAEAGTRPTTIMTAEAALMDELVSQYASLFSLPQRLPPPRQ
jgi:hypothetical protein